MSAWWAAAAKNVIDSELRSIKTQEFLKDNNITDYEDMRERMAVGDPHAVYPTNIYRYDE